MLIVCRMRPEVLAWSILGGGVPFVNSRHSDVHDGIVSTESALHGRCC